MLSGALKSLFAVSEAYPDLKANQNFLNLQEELTGTEGRIAYARQFYNDTVLRYNTKIQTFPAVVIAGMFRFTRPRVLRGRARVAGERAGLLQRPAGGRRHPGCRAAGCSRGPCRPGRAHAAARTPHAACGAPVPPTDPGPPPAPGTPPPA